MSVRVSCHVLSQGRQAKRKNEERVPQKNLSKLSVWVSCHALSHLSGLHQTIYKTKFMCTIVVRWLVSLPVASVEGGLPVGLSLVGPKGKDEELLAVAARLTAACGKA
eukprot:1154969-Pelagomonas_calceolata.AAC.2